MFPPRIPPLATNAENLHRKLEESSFTPAEVAHIIQDVRGRLATTQGEIFSLLPDKIDNLPDHKSLIALMVAKVKELTKTQDDPDADEHPF